MTEGKAKILCPSCGSQLIWKDGLRYPKEGSSPVQRYLCRSCGHRFSETQVKANILGEFAKASHSGKNVGNSGIGTFDVPIEKQLNRFPLGSGENVTSHGVLPTLTSVVKPLKALPCYSSKHRVCASEPKGAKNLVKVESQIEKRAAGATTQAEVKGKIVEHSFWMLKQGYRPATIKMRTRQLKRLTQRGANLLEPESVKETIAKQSWGVNGKICYVTAYATFALWMNIPFEPPHYKRVEKLPWVPTESDIDQLIAACSEKMATYLQLLKETGMRPGEAYYLKWADVDAVRKIVRVTPEKNSKPRILSISTRLIMMLENLPKVSERVFGNSLLRTHTSCFRRQRRRAAEKLNDPRLKRISFYSLRHFKAIIEYHRTKDIFHVMRVLGHKDIKNTLIYIDLEHEIFQNIDEDQFITKVARTPEEACKLREVGFEKFDEFNGVRLYCKRK